MSNTSAKSKTPSGVQLAGAMITRLEEAKARFIRERGKVFILLNSTRTEIEPSFHGPYAALQQKLVLEGTVSQRGRDCCQKVLHHGLLKAESIIARYFSALSSDRKRLYVPTRDTVLLITAGGIFPSENGANQDSVWVEPASDQEPFIFDHHVNVKDELERFEALCLRPQSVVRDSHRWFTGMHEAIMPYLRDYHIARPVLLHGGPSQHGKSSAAQRFYTLQGYGLIDGDVSVSSLQNSFADNGFLVLDNKEQDAFADKSFRD
jgi:hypothetical protein